MENSKDRKIKGAKSHGLFSPSRYAILSNTKTGSTELIELPENYW